MPVANFEIRLADLNDEYFALSVIDAPGLSADLVARSFPVAKSSLVSMSQPDLSSALNRSDPAFRAPNSTAGKDIRQFGTALFDLLFWANPDLHQCWAAFAAGAQPSKRLRLTLSGEASTLPWETLCDLHTLNGYVARHMSVVRFSPIPPAIAPLDVGRERLSMLVVFADPTGDLGQVLDKEREEITNALEPVVPGDLDIDYVEADGNPTLAQLEAKAKKRKYHILHYCGHAVSQGGGQLQFRGAKGGEPAPMSWEELHHALEPTMSSLRLVVLNTCQTAQPDKELASYTPFSSLATSFLNAGAAMVIAMQYRIRPDTASMFSKVFYEQACPRLFASAHSIEEAVRQARCAIAGAQNAAEWITPVTYSSMRGDEILKMPEERLEAYEAARRKQEEVNKLLEKARMHFHQQHWLEAARKAYEALQLDAGSTEALQLQRELLAKAILMIQNRERTGREILDALHLT